MSAVGDRPSSWARALATAALVAVSALSLGLSACDSVTAGGGGGSPTPPSETPRRGGTLTLSYLAEPKSLDPAVGWDAMDRQIEHGIYQGLLQYARKTGAAGTGLVPCLATEVPSTENGGISADGLVYTFHLRDGVQFQPPVNREVTAADFKYSFERMMGDPHAPATSFYRGVAGAEAYIKGEADEIAGYKAVDDATIEIRLESPDVSFLGALTMDFCDVVPREWVERWGEQFDRNPLGTGPFVFQEWTPGGEIVLTRNPHYWEEDRPYLDGVRYQLSLQPSAALGKLEHGEVDVLGDGIPVADLARVQADPRWSGQVFSQPLVAGAYLFMNVGRQPFADVRVRRALSWAVDRDALVRLQAGQATSLWQFYPEGMPGHEEGKTYYGYDPAKARRLLARAGYPNGFRTRLVADAADPDFLLLASVQADLAAVGVRADLETLDGDAYRDGRRTPGTLSAGGLGWSMDFPDPSDWIRPLVSRAGVAGGTNASFWWSPRLEKLFVEAQAMTDPEARIARFAEMQAYVATQAPYVPCYQPVQTTMCSETTGGFYLHPVYRIDPTQYWKK